MNSPGRSALKTRTGPEDLTTHIPWDVCTVGTIFKIHILPLK